MSESVVCDCDVDMVQMHAATFRDRRRNFVFDGEDRVMHSMCGRLVDPNVLAEASIPWCECGIGVVDPDVFYGLITKQPGGTYTHNRCGRRLAYGTVTYRSRGRR